ncbi:MAG TPA: hypothetical protein VHK01_05920, partial [Lacipirellulaceae bacterium]|nr:hypothetical protein [Lacipirellulaceae bacterium]
MKTLASSILILAILLSGLQVHLSAQQSASRQSAESTSSADNRAADDTPDNVLSDDEWQRVDAAVERALAWMATQQQEDGSFVTLARGQPGVTSLCMMAYMAHGHLAGTGQYGERLEKAIDYILGCQKRNGLIGVVAEDTPRLGRQGFNGLGTNTAYNHAISALLLSEVYGMGNAPQA